MRLVSHELTHAVEVLNETDMGCAHVWWGVCLVMAVLMHCVDASYPGAAVCGGRNAVYFENIRFFVLILRGEGEGYDGADLVSCLVNPM